MPHIRAEYSANPDDRLDVAALVADLRQTAFDSAAAELVGIRTHAIRCGHFRAADGNPANGFVHIIARPRRGRTLEVREIGPEMTVRRNTLRENAQSAA